MGAGHAHALYVHEHSLVHRLAPETKLVALFSFVVIVALTPRQDVWAFAAYAGMLGAVIRLARVKFRFVLLRLMVVLPVLAFALVIPFVSSGERVPILGLEVSAPGIWGAWNIAAKAVLGATASILLAATTEVPQILKGLGALHVPAVLVSVAGFMVRYLEIIAEEISRTSTAMRSRGYAPRWLWQSRPAASAAGTTFIRSFERGERVHQAMASRGFSGHMPNISEGPTPASHWAIAALLPLTAVLVALMSLWLS